MADPWKWLEEEEIPPPAPQSTLMSKLLSVVISVTQQNCFNLSTVLFWERAAPASSSYFYYFRKKLLGSWMRCLVLFSSERNCRLKKCSITSTPLNHLKQASKKERKKENQSEGFFPNYLWFPSDRNSNDDDVVFIEISRAGLLMLSVRNSHTGWGWGGGRDVHFIEWAFMCAWERERERERGT